MANMFNTASGFNEDISGWDTSNVTTMAFMFAGASVFNKPLNQWSTGNVTSLTNMFGGANAFNQDISIWNTVKVTNMSGMFTNATAFNQRIGKWSFAAMTTGGLGLDTTDFSNNYVKTSILLHDLSNNATVISKNIGNVGNYLNNTQTATALTKLTGAGRTNTISGTAITPNVTTFNAAGYAISDLLIIGYKTADLQTSGYPSFTFDISSSSL
jgi:surface protein